MKHMEKKSLQQLLLTIPFIFAMLSFSSCGGDGEDEVQGVSIVGEWKFDRGTHYGNDGEVQWVEYANITFNVDKSYKESKKYRGDPAIYAEGKWALDGSKLSLQMTYAKFGTQEFKDINEKTSYTVVKLTNDELVLDDGDGMDYFKR